MDAQALQAAGLGRGEAKVYLALLELGQTTTGPLVQRSGVSSSKVYEILERLAGKGLVSHVVHEKTKHFQAAPADRLVDWLEGRQKEVEGQRETLQSLLPELAKLQLANQQGQSAQVYEGYEGIRTMFGMILQLHKPGEEYLAFFLGKELEDEKVMQFLSNYHRRRTKNGIRVRLIADEKSKARLKPLAKFAGLQMRYYPDPMPLGVYIFKDYVGTVSFQEKPTVFLLKSATVAESYRAFFLGLWEKSKNA